MTRLSSPSIRTSAQACAITFKGHAKNKRQQDALYFLYDCYQEDSATIASETIDDDFCVAVSDGVGSSPYSQRCSKAIVRVINKLWLSTFEESNLNDEDARVENQSISQNINPQNVLTIRNINELMQQRLNKSDNAHKYQGASATLAMVTGQRTDAGFDTRITHVGDSRVYLLSNVNKTDTDTDTVSAQHWQCLTRDHNVLNELVDDKAEQTGIPATMQDYNATGMASNLYTLTEYFVFTGDGGDSLDNPTPKGEVLTLTLQAGDCLLICTDGVYDLVPSEDWSVIDNHTDLKAWLRQLKAQVYASDGNAYDNGTAVVVRVGE